MAKKAGLIIVCWVLVLGGFCGWAGAAELLPGDWGKYLRDCPGPCGVS